MQYSVAMLITESKVVLCRGKAQIRSFSIILYCTNLILFNATTVVVTITYCMEKLESIYHPADA